LCRIEVFYRKIVIYDTEIHEEYTEERREKQKGLSVGLCAGSVHLCDLKICQPSKEQLMVTQTKGIGAINLNEVEDLDGITVVRGGGGQRGWNGILYKQGMSAKNVGSQGLSINVATVPPGAIAYAHIHDGFEVMLFIVQGKVKHTYGENLSQEVINEAGDFIYIKPGVPHEVFNIGDEPLIAFVARSTADEWDKIINYPSQYRPDEEI
jgi:uncharacterized RmlC-like cupin family protein